SRLVGWQRARALDSMLSRGRLIAAWLAVDRIRRIVTNLPHLAVAQVHLALLLQVQRPGADAAEDGNLLAALIDRPVPVHALANVERVATLGKLVRGNQFRRRPGTEAVVARRLRRRQLHDP